MVLHNDRDTGLFNGDIGLVERLGDGHTVYFPDGEGARAVSLGRLPVCETVYAMTIHKSQGSEFDEVAVVLPDRSSPILTRELLYTAVTRAKARVTVYASPEVVGAAVRRRVERASGLARRLGWAREAEPDSAG
jgi:exodeoxyribonuclease V alpha subunit